MTISPTEFPIESLPFEIQAMVLSYFIPEDILSVSSVDTSHKRLSDVLWREKFKLHFPYASPSLSEVDWFEEFKKAYAFSYQDVPADKRKLFSLVKEGDVGGVIEFYKGKSPAELANDLEIKDATKRSLLQWIRQSPNQGICDYFYKKAIAYALFLQGVQGGDLGDFEDFEYFETYMRLYYRAVYNQPIVPQTAEWWAKYGTHVLLLGAENGRVAFVMQWLEHARNSNAYYGHVDAVLMKAAKAGHAEIVRALFSYPGMAVEKNGQEVLMLAAKNGHAEIVKDLMARTDIDMSKYAVKALTVALLENHHAVLTVLAPMVDISCINPSERRALMFAAVVKGHAVAEMSRVKIEPSPATARPRSLSCNSFFPVSNQAKKEANLVNSTSYFRA